MIVSGSFELERGARTDSKDIVDRQVMPIQIQRAARYNEVLVRCIEQRTGQSHHPTAWRLSGADPGICRRRFDDYLRTGTGHPMGALPGYRRTTE